MGADAAAASTGPKAEVAEKKAALEQSQKEGDSKAIEKARASLETAESAALTADWNAQAEEAKKNAASGNASNAEVASAKKKADQAEVTASSKKEVLIADECEALQNAKPQNKTAVSECLAKKETASSATKSAAATTGADATLKTPALKKTSSAGDAN